MARIRTIKPEFPQSETIGRLSRDARLLFVQLWTIADDDGRARAASRMLASLLYPYDDDAPKLIGKWLDELEGAGCIRRYEADGGTYLDIPNWQKHQKIDRPSKSRIPEFVEGSRVLASVQRASDADLGPSTKDLGKDLDQSCAVADATRTEFDEVFEQFWRAYPRRAGANPKAPARKVFHGFVKSGIDPAAIILGARRCAAADAKKIGTEYIPQAVKWLRDRRWEDYFESPARADTEPIWSKPPPEYLEAMARKQREANGEAVGTEIRSNAGLGQNGADHSRELPTSGGSSLRPEVRSAGGYAPDSS